MGEPHVFVLGHTWFYPKFDFLPASQFGIHSVYDASDHFMAQEFEKGSLQGISGKFLYDSVFDGV